jgi:hypothetical protein
MIYAVNYNALDMIEVSQKSCKKAWLSFDEAREEAFHVSVR